MPTREGKDAALASAFAELVAQGDAVTVRALKERARVGTDVAAAWLKANRPPVEVPPVPEGFAAAIWPLAFAAAREVAVEDVTGHLAQAREGLADALLLAEQAAQARGEAEADAERAVQEKAQAVADAAQARQELDQLQAHVLTLEAERARFSEQVRDLEARAVRAEGSVDTMREVLDTVRAEVRNAVTEAAKDEASGQ